MPNSSASCRSAEAADLQVALNEEATALDECADAFDRASERINERGRALFGGG